MSPDQLKARLEAYAIPCRRLTEEEVWERIRERAITRFAKMARTFVGRCRKTAIRPDELTRLLATHKPLSVIESNFIRICYQNFFTES